MWSSASVVMECDGNHGTVRWGAAGVLAVAGVLAISPHSLLTLSATTLFIVPVARLILGPSEILHGLKALISYVLVAVVIYVAQLAALPEYYGFSGGLGVGTDDSY